MIDFSVPHNHHDIRHKENFLCNAPVDGWSSIFYVVLLFVQYYAYCIKFLVIIKFSIVNIWLLVLIVSKFFY